MDPNWREDGPPDPMQDIADIEKLSDRNGHELSRSHEEPNEDLPQMGREHHSSEDGAVDDDMSIFSIRHTEGLPSVMRSESVLSAATSRRLERTATVASAALSRIRSRAPRKRFTHPLAGEKTTEDAIVDFDGPDDPYRPLNWPFAKKAITTVLYGLTTMGATFASSVYSSALENVAHDFQVGIEVSTLGISLLVFGFGLGPLFWAPLSEVYGRKPAVLIPTFVATIFAFGGGAAKDIQTIMICRFFQGFFGSAPVTNTGGVLGDIYSAEQRGAAIVGYAMAVVGGPTLGPIVGGAICDSWVASAKAPEVTVADV